MSGDWSGVVKVSFMALGLTLRVVRSFWETLVNTTDEKGKSVGVYEYSRSRLR